MISGIDGYGDVPLSGILLKSSTVNTDLKCSLKICAFSDGSEATVPIELFEVLIPEISCRLDLTHVMPKRFFITGVRGHYITKIFIMMTTKEMFA